MYFSKIVVSEVGVLVYSVSEYVLREFFVVDVSLRGVARLRRGQSFGEVALVDEGLRSASARAAQNDTRLLVIPRDKIVMLCETYPQLGYRLMYNLAADLAMKIRSTDLRIREQLLYRPTEK